MVETRTSTLNLWPQSFVVLDILVSKGDLYRLQGFTLLVEQKNKQLAQVDQRGDNFIQRINRISGLNVLVGVHFISWIELYTGERYPLFEQLGQSSRRLSGSAEACLALERRQIRDWREWNNEERGGWWVRAPFFSISVFLLISDFSLLFIWRTLCRGERGPNENRALEQVQVYYRSTLKHPQKPVTRRNKLQCNTLTPKVNHI